MCFKKKTGFAKNYQRFANDNIINLILVVALMIPCVESVSIIDSATKKCVCLFFSVKYIHNKVNTLISLLYCVNIKMYTDDQREYQKSSNSGRAT